MSYKYYKYFFHWKSSLISSICEQIVVTSSVHLMNNWPTRTSLKRMICLQITSFLNNHECTKESKGECVNFQWIMTIFMFEAWHCQSSCAFIISKMFKHPFVFHRKKTVIQVWNNMSKWWVNNAIFWGVNYLSAPASPCKQHLAADVIKVWCLWSNALLVFLCHIWYMVFIFSLSCSVSTVVM